jgi:enamine deaminase RidA (YjgF/YER057c/UK114 family)
MYAMRFPGVFIGLAVGYCAMMAPAYGEVRSAGVDPGTGLATAVVVEHKALAHTAQLLPVDAQGAVVGDTIEVQLGQVVKNLGTVLGEVGSGLDQIARLNVYVASDALVAEVAGLLKNYLGESAHPAATFVVAKPSDPAALLTLDAIAAVADDQAPESVLRHVSAAFPLRHGMAHVAVLPKGRTLYISGMAEQDTQDQAAASTGTMEQLHGVLALNKIGPEHVVHLKAFMKPAAEVPVAEKAMAAFYPGTPAPPMTFVDWLNAIPTEIELIAWVPGATESSDPVLHLWPADVTPSPVYCRYAVVNSPARIYTKGFTANGALDAAGQVHDIFAQLKAAIEPLGSDFEHMVKATYYVTAEDTSTALNEIRPAYYNPQRPPAASKATVAGSGAADRGLVLDMVAVPR